MGTVKWELHLILGAAAMGGQLGDSLIERSSPEAPWALVKPWGRPVSRHTMALDCKAPIQSTEAPAARTLPKLNIKQSGSQSGRNLCGGQVGAAIMDHRKCWGRDLEIPQRREKNLPFWKQRAENH